MAALPKKAKKLLNHAADLIFPRSCIHCSSTLDNSDYQYLCNPCAQEIFFAHSPACRTCGHPFFGRLAGQRTCPHCAELNPNFSQGKTLFLAKGPARSLLHELKYQSGFYVLKDLAKMLHQHPDYTDYLTNAHLVPVPLFKSKERERSYNQSLKIAQLLQQNSRHSSIHQLLTRVRPTQSQTTLDRKSRHQNVKNAFALAQDAHVIPHQQYILVDDVFTTGSTLNACAKVLLNAGAQHIKVATIGHG